MSTYPKVTAVQPRDGASLLVTFDNGIRKVYDCTPLLADEVFAPLRADWLFRAVRADPGGYGVSWSDDLDLSEAELWEHGHVAEWQR